MRTRARLDLEEHLSSPRFAPYLREVGGNSQQAYNLYEWNVQISGAFHASICGLEIALRNAMSARLERHRIANRWTGEWYDDAGGIFNTQTKKNIRHARDRIAAAGKSETPGRVVAELTFGFWPFLLRGGYQATLWSPALRHAFPGVRRQDLERNVAQIHELRNRIAHHEPIFGRDLESDYDALLTAAEAMSVRLAWWIDKRSEVPAMVDARP
jgi:hypothetical protein